MSLLFLSEFPSIQTRAVKFCKTSCGIQIKLSLLESSRINIMSDCEIKIKLHGTRSLSRPSKQTGMNQLIISLSTNAMEHGSMEKANFFEFLEERLEL